MIFAHFGLFMRVLYARLLIMLLLCLLICLIDELVSFWALLFVFCRCTIFWLLGVWSFASLQSLYEFGYTCLSCYLQLVFELYLCVAIVLIDLFDKNGSITRPPLLDERIIQLGKLVWEFSFSPLMNRFGMQLFMVVTPHYYKKWSNQA